MRHAHIIFFLSGAVALAQDAPSPPPSVVRVAPVPTIASRVEAEYSPEARAAGLQGTVLLALDVAPEGTFREVHIRRGLGFGLDERAVAAAEQWKYQTFNSNGATMMDVAEVPFQLQPPGPWRVVGSAFSFPPRVLLPGPRVKPTLSRYTSPNAGGCAKDLVYVPVNLTVGTDGNPNDVRVGAAIDDSVGKAAVEAVQSWQFRPGTAGGQAEATSGTILLECRNPSAPTATDGDIYRVGGGVSQPSVIFKVDPDYSEEARRAKYSGTVMLSVVVDNEGRARNIHVLKALGLGLDEEAIIAVTQWRFRSGMKDGQPVYVRATIEVNFRLL